MTRRKRTGNRMGKPTKRRQHTERRTRKVTMPPQSQIAISGL
jgi:hypothetical protein